MSVKDDMNSCIFLVLKTLNVVGQFVNLIDNGERQHRYMHFLVQETLKEVGKFVDPRINVKDDMNRPIHNFTFPVGNTIFHLS